MTARRRALVEAAVASALAGCAGIDLTPGVASSRFADDASLESVTTIHVAPVADVRALNRGGVVSTSVAMREAALSLLREKGYAPSLAGPVRVASAGARDADVLLEPAFVAASSGVESGIVLAVAIEDLEPDAVAPRTTRVRLRGVLVDTAGRTSVWKGSSVAESSFLAGVTGISPTATVYAAVYRAMSSLLDDIPAVPSGSR